MNPADYFKHYRTLIGFRNQQDARLFLAGKDVYPDVDYAYIDRLNQRLIAIIQRLNNVIHKSCRIPCVDTFAQEYILGPYHIIKDTNLLARLNNQGRRPEQVLFSWLRGYAITAYFIPAFSRIFDVNLQAITQIGDDDLKNIATFRRSPKADLEIHHHGSTFRIEVQSGFQGINDIKEHKVREARRVLADTGQHSICIHIDVFNGQVAFVQLDTIAENDVNFITRQQMEGQSVFTIDQNYFKWRLPENLPALDKLELDL